MSAERPVIIVKKVKGHGGGHHGGSWKVAYADFVTAMMAFFLVMWILGLSQDTRKSIASYFNDPSGMMKSHAGGKNPTLVSRDSTTGKASIMPSKEALLKEKKEKEDLKMAKKAIEKMVSANPKFNTIKKYVDITITAEGLRIELLEGKESLFFVTGSAKLEPKTVELLGMIGHEVSKLDNKIIVEGHTDARPYPGGLTGYSNWELSSDRANSARRALVPSVHPGQIDEVRGYADSRLRSPATPFHFSNRRISILLPYAHQTNSPQTKEIGPDDFGSQLKPENPGIAAAAQESAAKHEAKAEEKFGVHPEEK